MSSKNLNDYFTAEKIGEGAYGEVYKATEKSTYRTVAIKKLYYREDEQGFPSLAMEEIKYLHMLRKCPHVIKLLDNFIQEKTIGQQGPSMCLVFNYADSDLSGLISNPNLIFQLNHIKCIFQQILQGLQEIHSYGIIHRDLKAANILIHQGQLQLGDVGMATTYKTQNILPNNVVTLWYRAPELLLGSTKYGPEIDIWSAGIIFIELMTRKSPFPGSNEDNQLDLIIQSIGTPTPQTWPNCDQLPFYKTMLSNKPFYLSQLRKIYNYWDCNALDLLENLLAPPHRRITAERALQHPFFKTNPLPCKPIELSSLPSIHEWDFKKNKQDLKLNNDNNNNNNNNLPFPQTYYLNYYSQFPFYPPPLQGQSNYNQYLSNLYWYHNLNYLNHQPFTLQNQNHPQQAFQSEQQNIPYQSNQNYTSYQQSFQLPQQNVQYHPLYQYPLSNLFNYNLQEPTFYPQQQNFNNIQPISKTTQPPTLLQKQL